MPLQLTYEVASGVECLWIELVPENALLLAEWEDLSWQELDFGGLVQVVLSVDGHASICVLVIKLQACGRSHFHGWDFLLILLCGAFTNTTHINNYKHSN